MISKLSLNRVQLGTGRHESSSLKNEQMENEGWLLILPHQLLSLIFSSCICFVHMIPISLAVCHKYFIRYSKPVLSQVITNIRWHIRKMHGDFKHKFCSKAWFTSYGHSKEIRLKENYRCAISMDTLISSPFSLEKEENSSSWFFFFFRLSAYSPIS